ncbi:MAG: YbbR-like domain-containing protein, partial [Kiritimatiellaeota bacterium]|nr:YbbR-like domain-containing protein [Kiritimatiellota bacterium]
GVSVERIERKRIVLKLDRKSEKKVPVSLNITGALLEDYNYAVDSIVPAEVRITGPESILRRVKMIQASPIVLGKVNVEDFECVLKLRIGPNVSISQSSVTVKVDIFKKFDSRTFDSLTIKPFGFLPASSRKLEFDVKTASIRVSGHKQAVELLIADDLHPFVDISKIDKPGEYTLSVQCWSNIENISVKEIRPKTIQVTVH